MRGVPNNKWFFINKTASSDHLTHSPGDQWAEIQKHVQTGLKRPRKKATPTPQKPQILDDRALYDATIKHISCQFDPFGTASVPVDNTVRSLLHYYIYYYHPTIWTYNPETLRSKPYAFKDSVVEVVNTAISDSLSMYSLLAASTSRLQHVDKKSFRAAADKEYHFMEQGLQLMRKRIEAKSVDSKALNQIVRCIMFLGSAEAYRDNLPAARIHLLTALNLLGPDGVIKMTDKNLQGQLLMADLFQACIHMTKPHCGYEYDPGPASTLNLNDEELLSVDVGNHGQTLLAKDTVIFPAPLPQVVGYVLESYRINCQLNVEAMTRERAFETTHWVMKRNMAVRSRILAIKTTDDRVFALRMALIMWTLLAMNITGRVKTVKMMVVRLRETLERLSSSAWETYEDVHLWILLIGYCCARDESFELAWYADQVEDVSPWLYVFSDLSETQSVFTALESFLRGFLYHKPVQGSRIEMVANLLESSDRFVLSNFTPSSSASFDIVERFSTPL